MSVLRLVEFTNLTRLERVASGKGNRNSDYDNLTVKYLFANKSSPGVLAPDY